MDFMYKFYSMSKIFFSVLRMWDTRILKRIWNYIPKGRRSASTQKKMARRYLKAEQAHVPKL